MIYLRRILFWIFFGVYCVVCPLTVLYALGYVLKPQGEQRLVKTGLIYLASEPAGAAVFIENRRYTEKTPTMVKDLLPGTYRIKLVTKSEIPWTQTVEVEAGKSKAFDKVLLLPQKLDTQLLMLGPFDDLKPFGERPFLLLNKGKTLKEYYVYDLKEDTSWPLVSSDSVWSTAQVSSLTALSESDYLFMQVEMEEKSKFLWIELDDHGSTIRDITNLFSKAPVHVLWDPQMPGYLFSLRDNDVDRIKIASGAIFTQFLRGIHGFGIYKGKIYSIDKDYLFRRTDYGRNRVEVLMDDPELGQSLFGNKELFRVRVLTEKIVLFLGPDGELVATRLPYRFAERGIRGFIPARRNKHVLLWQSHRLGILDFSPEIGQEEVFEQGAQLRWIYEDGQDLREVFWVYDESHVLFQDGDRIYLLELDPYGSGRARYLFDVKRDTSIFYVEEKGKVYFLESAGGHLSGAYLLPPKQVLSMPFTGDEKRESVEQ